MAVTIKQIAEEAGVSRGTVDRVLHNRGKVRPEVEEEIKKAIRKLGYIPNKAGRLLAEGGAPVVIGYVLPGGGDGFYGAVMEGIRRAEEELTGFGLKTVVMGVIDNSGDLVHDYLSTICEMANKGLDVLCVAAPDAPEIQKRVNLINDSGLPVATLGRRLSKINGLCHFGGDNINEGRTAGGLLALCKNERALNILIVNGAWKDRAQNDRILGFHQALRGRKVEYRLTDMFEAKGADEIAYEKTTDRLNAHDEINAVYITAGGVGGVCRAISEFDGRRKNNIRVVCHDEGLAARPYLDSGVIDYVVCQEPFDQGYQSVKRLYDHFSGDSESALEDTASRTRVVISENL